MHLVVDGRPLRIVRQNPLPSSGRGIAPFYDELALDRACEDQVRRRKTVNPETKALVVNGVLSNWILVDYPTVHRA